MGNSRFDSTAYTAYATSTASMTHHDYTARAMPKGMDPKDIKVRESRNGTLNPLATPVIVGLDVTGSMGMVVEAMRKGLGTLFEQIIEREPVSDPHVLAIAIGDMDCDSAPCQATQFEADPVTIGKQVEELYLERGGGGNNHESYLGPLYFALMRTDCDAFTDKPPRKGFLFTVGDEEPQDILTKAHAERFFGDQIEADLTAEQLVNRVSENWNYFHLIVMEGSYASTRARPTKEAWAKLLGQRAIPLTNHTKMAEVIISIIETVVGRDKEDIADSWKDKGTTLAVREAISGLPATARTGAIGPVTL